MRVSIAMAFDLQQIHMGFGEVSGDCNSNISLEGGLRLGSRYCYVT
jgi:hypothetical protein